MNAARTANPTAQLLRDLDRAIKQSREATAMAERSLSNRREQAADDRFAEAMRGLE